MSIKTKIALSALVIGLAILGFHLSQPDGLGRMAPPEQMIGA